MKLIESYVQRLRDANLPVLASYLKTWKQGLAFIVLAVVASLGRNGVQLNYWLRVAMAVIALATWVMYAWFKRKWWKIGREEPEHLD